MTDQYVQEPAEVYGDQKNGGLIIDNAYRIEQDTYNFILVQTIVGKSREGQEKLVERKSYHPTLSQALKEVLNREAHIIVRDGCTLQQAIDGIQNSAKAVARAVHAEKKGAEKCICNTSYPSCCPIHCGMHD